MIDTLNACWRVPLIETMKGGRKGGGTSLTAAGEGVLERYRKLDAALQRTAQAYGAELLALIGPVHGAD